MKVIIDQLIKVGQKRAAGVAVFADDESVAIAGRNVQTLGEKKAEPGGVQVCARTEHPLLGQPRELPGDIGEHVN